MDIASLKLAYDGLKSAKEIFTAFEDLKSKSESLSKVNEAVKQVGLAQDILYDVREELFKLQEDNNNLRKQFSEHEAWELKLSRYELVKTEGGAIVYKSREGVEHFICPSCVVKKEIHPLQDGRLASGTFDCPGCDKGFPINRRQSVSPRFYK